MGRGDCVKAVITVMGKDTVGIVARVSAFCAENSMNVTDVSQTILDDVFVMIMMVDLKKARISLADFGTKMKKIGEELGVVIYVVHEDVFDSMHRI